MSLQAERDVVSLYGAPKMSVEERITKIETLSVRIAALSLLILALIAVVAYSLFELSRFVARLFVLLTDLH